MQIVDSGARLDDSRLELPRWLQQLAQFGRRALAAHVRLDFSSQVIFCRDAQMKNEEKLEKSKAYLLLRPAFGFI